MVNDMASILNDFMLKKFTCSECDKYLSVLPVKVYPNRKFKCGRCWRENDGGVVSLCNNVLKNCLFRCVNRYEGCNKLLNASEVETHEKQCGGIHDCPKCEYKFTGSGYELLFHYKNQHPQSFLLTAEFNLKLNQHFRDRYLYLVNDMIFFVLIDNLSKDKILYLSVVSLLQYKNVNYWIVVKKTKDRSLIKSTEMKLCQSVNNFDCKYSSVQTNLLDEVTCWICLDLSQNTNIVNKVLSISKNKSVSVYTQTQKKDFSINDTNEKMQNTEPLEGIFGVKLTDEFKKSYPGYQLTPCGTALFKYGHRIDLVCSNCKQLTGPNVYKCKSNFGHVICWDCKAWCGICHTKVDGWDESISNVNELLLLPCKWKCGEYFLGGNRNHELYCKKIKYKCPICRTVLDMKQLCKHLILAHKNYVHITDFNLNHYLKEYNRQTSSTVYFFQNSYLFQMILYKFSDFYKASFKCMSETRKFAYEIAIIHDAEISYNTSKDNTICLFQNCNPRLYLKRLHNL